MRNQQPAHCPAPHEHSAFLADSLPGRRDEAIALHLDTCAHCQTAVAKLEAIDDELLSGIRLAMSTPPLDDEHECRRVVARIQAIAASDSDAPAASSAAVRPARLGGYELVAKLGEGGMGAVFKALQPRLDRWVAVKVLPADRLGDARAVARFQREIKAVGKLQHPNIVVAHDAGEEDGTHYLVMEYVEGCDLSRLVWRCGPLPLADACELVRQAALALQHAHERGLVHRDVKPSNLMLTKGGQVKLLDLGLALLGGPRTAGDELTGTNQLMGTADYMAPEQAGDSHAVDIRADVYSLGCTLYKLLTGEAPFAGPRFSTPLQKMMAHVQSAVPPISQRRNDVPAALVMVLKGMLAKKPADRFATPAAAAALAPFVANSDLVRLAASCVDESPAGLDALPSNSNTGHALSDSLTGTHSSAPVGNAAPGVPSYGSVPIGNAVPGVPAAGVGTFGRRGTNSPRLESPARRTISVGRATYNRLAPIVGRLTTHAFSLCRATASGALNTLSRLSPTTASAVRTQIASWQTGRTLLVAIAACLAAAAAIFIVAFLLLGTGGNGSVAFTSTFRNAIELAADGKAFKVGHHAVTRLVNWNDDALLDVLVGDGDGYVWLFRNVGSKSDFRLAPGEHVKVGQADLRAGTGSTTACLVDLTGDANRDLIVAHSDDRIQWFVNRGADGHPDFNGPMTLPGRDGAEFRLPSQCGARIDVGDWDEDGRPDILAGGYTGSIVLFSNTGTAGSPRFESAGVSLTYQGKPWAEPYNVHPAIFDLNRDGHPDVAYGTNWGYVSFYISDPPPQSRSSFTFRNHAVRLGNLDFRAVAGDDTTPTFGDVNGDGTLDMISGGAFGKLWLVLGVREVPPQASKRSPKVPITLLRRFDAPTEKGIREVAFVSGDRALCSSDDFTVRLLRLSDGHTLQQFPGYCFAVGAGERSVFTGDQEGTIRVVDLATGHETIRWPTAPADAKLMNSIWHLRASPDGGRLLSNGADGCARVWRVPNGEEAMKFSAKSQFHAVAVSPDWRQFAACDYQDPGDINNKRIIRRWDIDSKNEIGSLVGHDGSVRYLEFSSDGRTLLSASGPRMTMKGSEEMVDGTIRLWDWDSGREIRRFLGHYGGVNACRFSPDENFVLSVGDDRTIRLWHVESGTLVHSEAIPMDPGRSVHFSADGKRAISAHGALVKIGDNKWQPGSDNCLRLWSIALPDMFDPSAAVSGQRH